MFTLNLSKQEFQALWETLYEKENPPPSEEKQELSPGFKSFAKKYDKARSRQ